MGSGNSKTTSFPVSFLYTCTSVDLVLDVGLLGLVEVNLEHTQINK